MCAFEIQNDQLILRQLKIHSFCVRLFSTLWAVDLHEDDKKGFFSSSL